MNCYYCGNFPRAIVADGVHITIPKVNASTAISPAEIDKLPGELLTRRALTVKHNYCTSTEHGLLLRRFFIDKMGAFKADTVRNSYNLHIQIYFFVNLL